MKNYVINNGTFTANGNFSGYTALGERVHIYNRQMQALGWDKPEDVKFPFYVIGTTKQIGELDSNGQPVMKADGTPKLNDRLTALSAFKTREEIKQAHADSALLDIEIAQEIRSQASTAGLSESAINALANAAF
jgi:hypothetical protein